MDANLTQVIKIIEGVNWDEGDCAVVIISSVSAVNPDTSQSLAYNVSKAALNQVARYLSRTQPVRINTVSPATFTGPNPVVTKQEIANVVAFLCSPLASGINGKDIRCG